MTSAEIAIEKGEAEVALEAAIPALEEAAEALNDLKKDDITEIRSFAKPHILVQKVSHLTDIYSWTFVNLCPSFAETKVIETLASRLAYHLHSLKKLQQRIIQCTNQIAACHSRRSSLACQVLTPAIMDLAERLHLLTL